MQKYIVLYDADGSSVAKEISDNLHAHLIAGSAIRVKGRVFVFSDANEHNVEYNELGDPPELHDLMLEFK